MSELRPPLPPLPDPAQTPRIAAAPARPKVGVSAERPKMGLRREVALLLPLALLLLAGLAAFTLLSYRSALDLLTAERRDDAERLARAAAATLAARPETGAAELRRQTPLATGLALLDRDGAILASAGEIQPIELPAEAGRETSFSAGPSARLPGVVAGFAQVPAAARVHFVRVELPARALSGQRQSLRILVPVVLGGSAAVVVLVLLFLRHLLAPFDSLVERARAAGELGAGGAGGDGDEIAALVVVFERALAALARPAAPAPHPGVEEDLAALERALAPSLSSGLLLLDRDGAMLALNPAGAAILGISPPAPATPLRVALAPHRRLAELLAEAIAAGRGLERCEVSLEAAPPSAQLRGTEPRAAGERPTGPRTLGLTLHPLRRDDGAVRGQLVFFADLTEARRAEEESRLEQSLAQLGELAAGVAHELRNSLATLNGYLALIARRPGEETIADYLVEIRRESGHLERVVEDFLAFARPGSARLEDVDPETILRRAANDPALGGAPVVIRRTGADPPGLRLHADPHLLERALRNLLHNAVQAAVQAAAAAPATAEPVEVELATSPSGVAISISDRGAGVPAEVRARLFQPFSVGRPGGVGLGLALAHRIVALHGGALRLEEREGGGTRAVIVLPLARGQRAAVEPAVVPP